MSPLSPAALDQLFFQAHTHGSFAPRDVEDSLLVQVYETLRWGPTAANSNPLRVVFVKSAAEKSRLLPCVAAGNTKKVEAAPVTAILAMDMRFHEKLPHLFPHVDAKAWYEGNDAAIAENAMRNSSLQGGYFVLAARALGLACGPMSGFDAEKVRVAFLEGTPWRPNFLCNLGYPADGTVHRRNPRLDFATACRIV
jgi:3-hydroxypropanoate dehydrogenase